MLFHVMSLHGTERHPTIPSLYILQNLTTHKNKISYNISLNCTLPYTALPSLYTVPNFTPQHHRSTQYETPQHKTNALLYSTTLHFTLTTRISRLITKPSHILMIPDILLHHYTIRSLHVTKQNITFTAHDKAPSYPATQCYSILNKV